MNLTDAELRSIAAVMTQAGVRFDGELRARMIAGGRSNLTFRLDDDAQSWVLRTPPRAGRTPSAHDVGREFRITSALAGSVPVAPAVAFCDDESLIGGPFAVAGFVEGRSIQSLTDIETLDGVQRTAAMRALVETLAALHRVDHVAVGLERFGRPDGYAARQTKRWAGQWEIVGDHFADPIKADAARLAQRLADSNPEQRSTGIVHGDYRIDNTLLRIGESDAGRADVEVVAVVDWELSTIGDPVADVALMCVYRHPALDLVLGAPSAWTSPLLPDIASIAADYEAAGGVPLEAWEFHLALGYFKLAVIAAGIDHRYRVGATSGPGFDTAGEAVGPLLGQGLSLIEHVL